MIRAVIFDMDGVLIDTVQLGLRARTRLLAVYGVDLGQVPDPQGEGHRAASTKNLLTAVESATGVRIDHDEFAQQIRSRMDDELRAQGVTADEGLIAFLQDLRQHNVACVVASSSQREGVDIKLDVLGIREYFSVIVTGSDVRQHKPAPDLYLFAMKQLGVAADNCVIFEDSLTGIEAGNAAGCRVVGFTQYNPPLQQLRDVVGTVVRWSDVSYAKLNILLQG
jgi:beta-phosphoglucomutase